MLISAENKVDEKICHIFQQRRSQLGLKYLKAGRCRLHLPGFENIYQDQGVLLSQLHQQNYWYYCLVGAHGTSAPPTGCHTHLRTQKKGLQSRLTLKTSSKEGSHLLSRIALQYHRRKRA